LWVFFSFYGFHSLRFFATYIYISIWVSLFFFQRIRVSPFSFFFFAFIHHEGRLAGEKKNRRERRPAEERDGAGGREEWPEEKNSRPILGKRKIETKLIFCFVFVFFNDVSYF
jgi:hypothetical protein